MDMDFEVGNHVQFDDGCERADLIASPKRLARMSLQFKGLLSIQVNQSGTTDVIAEFLVFVNGIRFVGLDSKSDYIYYHFNQNSQTWEEPHLLDDEFAEYERFFTCK